VREGGDGVRERERVVGDIWRKVEKELDRDYCAGGIK